MSLSFVCIAAVVFIDQVVKYCIIVAEAQLPLPVIPGFLDIGYVRNTGGAFGLLSGEVPLFLFLSFFSLALIISIYAYLRVRSSLSFIEHGGFCLIIGGAVSNMLDRILRGSVVDFIDVYVYDYHWPAFNVADSAICAGVTLLCIQYFFKSAE